MSSLPRMGRLAAIALTLFASAALAACGSDDGTASSAGTPKPARATVASCDEAGLGGPPADWRRDATSTGPFGLVGPARDFHDRKSVVKLDSGQFGMKLPAVVEGSASVVVSVPTDLRHDVGIDFGNLKTAERGGEANQRVTFEPCANRQRTGWPGGLVLESRKPIELLVQVEGEQQIRTLQLG